MSILGRGVFSFRDAARLIRLPSGRVRAWFSGRANVFETDHAAVEGQQAISFLDLIEVYVAGHLREHGVTLQHLRKVHGRLQTDWKTPHPFARRQLLTDGQAVFVRGLDRTGDEEIYEAFTKQKAFPKMILPFLKRIDYSPVNDLAASWQIADGVVIDPGISFGKPVLRDCSIPTYILAAAYKANGSRAETVADWYEIAPRDVLRAVAFEDGLAA